MFKLFALFIFVTTCKVFVSCCKDDGYNFRWRDIRVTNLDLSNDRPVPLSGNSTAFNKYGFRLSFVEERVAKVDLTKFSFSQANAFDCRSYFKNTDTITSIEVITRMEFDNTHPPGSSISSYLVARPSNFYQYYPEYKYVPLEQNLPFLNDDQQKFIHNAGIDAKFNNVSPNPGQHRFVITVLFKNGKTLVDSTDIQIN